MTPELAPASVVCFTDQLANRLWREQMQPDAPTCRWCFTVLYFDPDFAIADYGVPKREQHDIAGTQTGVIAQYAGGGNQQCIACGFSA